MDRNLIGWEAECLVSLESTRHNIHRQSLTHTRSQQAELKVGDKMENYPNYYK